MKKFIFGILFLVFLGIGIAFWVYQNSFENINFVGKNDSKIITIPQGSLLPQISKILVDSLILEDKFWFETAVKISQKAPELKAGTFRFEQGKTNQELIKTLVSGKQVLVKITIPEGMSYKKIAKIFAKELGLNSEIFTSMCEDSTFLQGLEISQKNVEGYLLPETYFFPKGLTEKEAIEFLVEEHKKFWKQNHLDETLSQRLKLTKNEILTLASIIEGEAIIDSERTTISGVYVNRLEKGIKLQADPTIQYILPDAPKRLLFKDLEIDSPYNTYLYKGLPPTPINNPGKNSILAALSPKKVPFIYFVATGDGGHTFTKTLKEHLKAKAKFDEVRRRVAREKRRKNRP